MSCQRNNNGEHPSCIEALLDGPGAEDHGFCEPCAIIIRRQWKEAIRQNAELEKMVRGIAATLAFSASLLSAARLASSMNSKDRIRVPRIPQDFRDLGELVDAALASYRLDRWAGQDNYVELWVEKDALAGILAPIAREYHVTMMVNRGYSSQTAMYDAGKRFLRACYGKELPYMTGLEVATSDGKKVDTEVAEALEKIVILDQAKLPDPLPRNPILLYLGDHDPSGEDMVRDIEARLLMFGIQVDVRKVALTTAQVEEFNPPPNPAKMADPRALEYVDKHGPTSWEVDALPPDALDQIIRESLDQVVDTSKVDKIKAREKKDKALLMKALKSLKSLKSPKRK